MIHLFDNQIIIRIFVVSKKQQPQGTFLTTIPAAFIFKNMKEHCS